MRDFGYLPHILASSKSSALSLVVSLRFFFIGSPNMLVVKFICLILIGAFGFGFGGACCGVGAAGG